MTAHALILPDQKEKRSASEFPLKKSADNANALSIYIRLVACRLGEKPRLLETSQIVDSISVLYHCYHVRKERRLMEHSLQKYMVQDVGEGMVAISAYLTHEGVFKASEWIRFRAPYEEVDANQEMGLEMPIECPFCGEVLQFPSIVVSDGWLGISPTGIEELESRGIEFS